MAKIAIIGDIHGKPKNPLGRLCDYNEDLFEKMRWIIDYCNENLIFTVVHLGDIYDKPEASDEWKNKFIQLWRQYDGTFYSIIGLQHDLYGNTDTSYSKTCLYNLELSGILQVLREPVTIHNVTLWPLSIYTSKAKEEIKTIESKFKLGFHNIILAHQFYDWGLDPSAGFEKEDIERIGVECSLALGHDHRQRPIEKVGMVNIVRPGSLMRTELSEVMIDQKPSIAIYDSNTNVWTYVEVPHRDINEIYNVEEYRVHKSNSKLFKQNLKPLEDLSKYFHGSDTVITCSEGLKRVDCPKEEFEYLRACHQLCGQEF